MPEDKLPLDIAAFTGDCRSSIQGEVDSPLTMNGLARRLLELKPEATQSWIERIAAIGCSEIQEIVDCVPDGWTSEIRKQFAIDYLDASRDRLMSELST